MNQRKTTSQGSTKKQVGGRAARRRAKRRKQVAVLALGLMLLVLLSVGGYTAVRRIIDTKRGSEQMQKIFAEQFAHQAGQLTEAWAAVGVPVIETRDEVTYATILGYEMILVNKQYSVPRTYGSALDSAALAAWNAMSDAAATAGYPLHIVSGFRSYETQANIHNNYLNSGEYSYEYVKEMSAEPGHSEHQLGLALDIREAGNYNLSTSFDQTPEFRWLEENAPEYGFIMRYPEGKTWATGYMYEPWHFRYVGPGLARQLADSGLTVEEVLGIPNEPRPAD